MLTGGLVDPWWAFDLVLVIRGDSASGTDPVTVRSVARPVGPGSDP